MPCTKAREIDLAEFAVDSRAPEWAEFRGHYPLCPDCSRAVARLSALRAALEAERASDSAHVSEAQIVALGSGGSALAPQERERLEAHLAGCARCRTELAGLQSFDFAAVAEAPERPGPFDRLASAIAAALRRPALVAAAIALLAVPAAVLLWKQMREMPPANPPVAEVEPSAPPVAVEETPPAAEPEPVAPVVPPPQEKPGSPEPARIAKQPPGAPPPEPAIAEAKRPEPAPEPARPIEIAALLPSEPPRYAPGALAGGPSVRTGDSARSLAGEVPPPVALGPVQVGATSHESPDLYWFLPEATPLPVEVTVIAPDAPEPLLEAMLPGPHAAGVHGVSLAERGLRLQRGVDYQWYVALVRDPERRSQDAVSGAAIRYAPPSAEVAARLASPAPGRTAHLYAESGFWYDSFDQLSKWLAAERGAARLHEHRAALLEQVGLRAVAAFERNAAPAAR